MPPTATRMTVRALLDLRRKDEVLKRKLFERFGDGEPLEIRTVRGGAAITSPLLPGFFLPLAKLFA